MRERMGERMRERERERGREGGHVKGRENVIARKREKNLDLTCLGLEVSKKKPTIQSFPEH